MRTLLEPHLVNDTFGDPGLYVDFRDEHRALLFDLADIGVLPPRKLMRLSHIFVTHTHMDHLAGFDHLLRVVLGRKPHLAIFGGPNFVSLCGRGKGARQRAQGARRRAGAIATATTRSGGRSRSCAT